MKKGIIAWFIVSILALIGEIQCIYKAIDSNWDPIGKRELVYTISAFTPVGPIIGWFNIADDEIEEE